MSKFEVEYQNYSRGNEEKSLIAIKESDIKTIDISYDGGRLYVTINGHEFYNNLGFGNDACVSFTKTND